MCYAWTSRRSGPRRRCRSSRRRLLCRHRGGGSVRPPCPAVEYGPHQPPWTGCVIPQPVLLPARLTVSWEFVPPDAQTTFVQALSPAVWATDMVALAEYVLPPRSRQNAVYACKMAALLDGRRPHSHAGTLAAASWCVLPLSALTRSARRCLGCCAAGPALWGRRASLAAGPDGRCHFLGAVGHHHPAALRVCPSIAPGSSCFKQNPLIVHRTGLRVFLRLLGLNASLGASWLEPWAAALPALDFACRSHALLRVPSCARLIAGVWRRCQRRPPRRRRPRHIVTLVRRAAIRPVASIFI